MSVEPSSDATAHYRSAHNLRQRRWLVARWCGALLVAAVGYFCFLEHRDGPPFLFWDENYHVTSAERYVEGLAQLTPHPPLGLLLIAAGERLTGANQRIDKHILTTKKSITGDELPQGFDFSGMRLVPGLLATLGAVIFYALMLELTGATLPACLLSGLYLFENAFVVHFRAVHLEGIQMFFVLGSLWLFVRAWRRAAPLPLHDYAALSALCTLAIMVKVNAVFLLLLPLLLGVRDWRAGDPAPPGQRLRHALAQLVAGAAALAVIIAAVMVVHLQVGRNPGQAGTPAWSLDYASMSARYRDYVDGHGSLTPQLVWTATLDEFRYMENDHRGVPKLRHNDPTENGSAPWHWPFHDRNINYRWDRANGMTAYVELAGNQLAWYAGTIAVLASMAALLRHRLTGIAPGGRLRTWQLMECFTALYVAFMLMNLWLASQRVMYLYHYFPGLLLSYLLLALWWQRARELSRRFARHGNSVLTAVTGLFFLCFLFFLPLTNHVPLTKDQCEQRNIGVLKILDCH